LGLHKMHKKPLKCLIFKALLISCKCLIFNNLNLCTKKLFKCLIFNGLVFCAFFVHSLCKLAIFLKNMR
jgi:hypothetical protein